MRRLREALSRGREGVDAAPPRSYTPKHLAEKIITSRSALEGERKQVTVLFADVKVSTELVSDLDAEEGHGIMTLFGAAIAQENRARRGLLRSTASERRALPLYRTEAYARDRLGCWPLNLGTLAAE